MPTCNVKNATLLQNSSPVAMRCKLQYQQRSGHNYSCCTQCPILGTRRGRTPTHLDDHSHGGLEPFKLGAGHGLLAL